MSPVTSAVVARATQLLNNGFASGFADPQSVPASSRRLEFVGGSWVMFIPYNQGGKHMVVAWVPKQGVDPSVDDEEHQAPPPGAPAYTAQPGPVTAPATVLGSVEANQLQAQVDWLMKQLGHQYAANVYAAQAMWQANEHDPSAAAPYIDQAYINLGLKGQGIGDPTMAQPAWPPTTAPAPPPRVEGWGWDGFGGIIPKAIENVSDYSELTPEERAAELGPSDEDLG